MIKIFEKVSCNVKNPLMLIIIKNSQNKSIHKIFNKENYGKS